MKKLGREGAWSEFKKRHIRWTIFGCAALLLLAILLKSLLFAILGVAIVALRGHSTLVSLRTRIRCSCNKLVTPGYNYCPWCAREVPQELKVKR